MSRTLIQNAEIYTPERPAFRGWLLTDGEKIADLGENNAPEALAENAGTVIDAEGLRLLPGLIDIHTHGCLGHCTMDADPEGLLGIASYHARHGVTTFLPTTMTAPKEQTIKAIRCVTGFVGKRGDHAKIPGIHLEGPYFNPAKCGAQDTAYIRCADPEECRAFLDAGAISRISIAPEFPENMAAADIFREAGVSISAGHTAAGYDVLKEAVSHGFRSVTHLFNGMGAFNHRDPGTIGSALALDEYACELICDNIHSHPAAQKIAWKAKGRDKIVLITDMIRPSGLPDGTYFQESTGQEIRVSHNGTELRIPGGALAGSALTMDRALKNFTENSGASLNETWPCSSLNAARLIGIGSSTGSIEKGKLADLVLMDKDYRVMRTIIEGRTVYSRN